MPPSVTVRSNSSKHTISPQIGGHSGPNGGEAITADCLTFFSTGLIDLSRPADPHSKLGTRFAPSRPGGISAPVRLALLFVSPAGGFDDVSDVDHALCGRLGVVHRWLWRRFEPRTNGGFSSPTAGLMPWSR